MIQVYIAASFPRKDEAIKLARDILEISDIRGGFPFDCASRWLSIEQAGYGQGKVDTRFAKIDMADVSRCDIFVELSGDDKSHGGRSTELGMAIAWGKKVFVYGPYEQVFHGLPCVTLCSDWRSLQATLLDAANMLRGS